MAKETLATKLKLGAATLVVTGLPSFLNACQTSKGEDLAILGAILQGSASRADTYEQARDRAIAGGLLRDLGIMEHERDLADRSGINIDIDYGKKEEFYPEKQINSKAKKTVFFTCNSYNDSNRNLIADYPEDYLGIKNKFRDDERMIIVLHNDYADETTKSLIKLFNPSGKMIADYDINNTYGRGESSKLGDNANYSETISWLIENGGYGTFKAEFYINNSYIGSTEFEITPSKK